MDEVSYLELLDLLLELSNEVLFVLQSVVQAGDLVVLPATRTDRQTHLETTIPEQTVLSQ